MIRRANGVVLLKQATNRRRTPKVDLLTRCLFNSSSWPSFPFFLFFLFFPFSRIQTPSSNKLEPHVNHDPLLRRRRRHLPRRSRLLLRTFTIYRNNLLCSLSHRTPGIFTISETLLTKDTAIFSLSYRHMNWATSTCTTHWQHTSDTISRWNSSISLHRPPGNPHHHHPLRTAKRRRSRQRKQSSRLGRPRRSPGEMPMPFASRLRLARETKGRIRPRRKRRQRVPVWHSSFSFFHRHFILESKLVGSFRPFLFFASPTPLTLGWTPLKHPHHRPQKTAATLYCTLALSLFDRAAKLINRYHNIQRYLYAIRIYSTIE